VAYLQVLLSMAGMQEEVGKCWLQIAKLARKAGQYQSAECAVLRAVSLGAPNSRVERSKLLWDQGQHHLALVELQVRAMMALNSNDDVDVVVMESCDACVCVCECRAN
jgi:hypothetical protein